MKELHLFVERGTNANNDGEDRAGDRELERELATPTDNEEHLDNDVADDGVALIEAVRHERDERRVERDSDSNVERAQQQQPVPADLEDAVVQQDEARLALLLHLVLWHVAARQVLDLRRTNRHLAFTQSLPNKTLSTRQLGACRG